MLLGKVACLNIWAGGRQMGTGIAKIFLENELDSVKLKSAKYFSQLDSNRLTNDVYKCQRNIIVGLINNIENDTLPMVLENRIKDVQDTIIRLQKLGNQTDLQELWLAREEREILYELSKRWIIWLQHEGLSGCIQ
jgi:hypothetical protein